MFANTPAPPYYAVIFTNTKTGNLEGYAEMANRMEALAKMQDGFLGMEHASGDVNITISYWRDELCILKWKENAEHLLAQQKGREQWYSAFVTRVCKVERAYSFKL